MVYTEVPNETTNKTNADQFPDVMNVKNSHQFITQKGKEKTITAVTIVPGLKAI